MDKFGIFNLLNSFFPLNSQKNQSSPIDAGASSLASNLFSSLGKNLFKPSSNNNQSASPLNKSPEQAVPLPLQKNMLTTINSHDEIVKRVKEKNAQPKF